MKKKMLTFTITIVFLLIVVLCSKQYNDLSRSQKYVQTLVTESLNNIANSVFFLETLINDIDERGYILESDLAYIESSYRLYGRGVIKLEHVSNYYVKESDSQVVEDNSNSYIEYENIKFYTRLQTIMPKKDYQFIESKRIKLSENDKIAIRKSYNYINKVADIIRTHYSFMDYALYDIEVKSNNSSLEKTVIHTEFKIKNEVGTPSIVVNLSNSDWITVINKITDLNKKERHR